MTIEIHEPKVEALLQKWMESGLFRSEEEAIGTALESAVTRPVPTETHRGTTGAALFEALRRCPYPDVDLEPSRSSMPVRDFSW